MGVCCCIVAARLLDAVWFSIACGLIGKRFAVAGGGCFGCLRWVGVIFFRGSSGNGSGLVGHGLIKDCAHLILEKEGVQTLVVIEGEADCTDDILVVVVNFFNSSLDVVKVAQVGIGVDLLLKLLYDIVAPSFLHCPHWIAFGVCVGDKGSCFLFIIRGMSKDISGRVFRSVGVGIARFCFIIICIVHDDRQSVD